MDEPMADHVVSMPATSSSTQLPTTEEKSVSEKIWVVDDEPSPDYPVWTRANVGEVFPDIVTPMGWTMWGFEGAELGWRDALVRTGAFSPDEFAADRKEIVGSFGGYCYLNVSVSRVFATELRPGAMRTSRASRSVPTLRRRAPYSPALPVAPERTPVEHAFSPSLAIQVNLNQATFWLQLQLTARGGRCSSPLVPSWSIPARRSATPLSCPANWVLRVQCRSLGPPNASPTGRW